MSLRIVNIERGLPTGDEALKLLSEAIDSAKRDGVTAIKIIHGYGSTGSGGVLRQRIQKSLANRRNQGKIRDCVFGDRWNSFDEHARRILDQCPALRRDSDLNRGNEGISIVLI